MKKMSVKREILTIIVIAVVILAISSQVFATGTSGSPIQIPTINTNTTSVDTNTVANETTNEVTPVNTTVAPITNTTGSTYQNTTTLPQTGDASDYAIFMIIIVAVIVAIYAYRKVKEYNI